MASKGCCTDCNEPLNDGRNAGLCNGCKEFQHYLTWLRLGDIDYSPEAVAERARRADIYRSRFERGEAIFQEELTNGSPENHEIQVAQSRRREACAADSDEADS